jgi:hypothetical protein
MAWMFQEPDAVRRIELFGGLTRENEERLTSVEKLGLMTEELPISSWSDFERWSSRFEAGWCFRGHGMASWSLEPSLNRRLWRTVRVGSGSVTQEINPRDNEIRLLLEFQRRAQQHQLPMPPNDQHVDWLTTMQHYRVPTRLLDWTRSPYVALYFAMEEERDGDAALWAIDLGWFEHRSHQLLHIGDKGCPDVSDLTAYHRYINQILLREDNLEIVVSASPEQQNERMTIQKGVLLCSLRRRLGFVPGLSVLLFHPAIVERQVVSKIVVKKEHRTEFLNELRHRDIHHAALFPGSDELGHSLADELEARILKQCRSLRQEMTSEDQAFQQWLKEQGAVWVSSKEPS